MLPDPPDFFLWGYLKERVYQEKPRTLITLKNTIEEEIKAIKPEIFKRYGELPSVMVKM